MSSWIRSLQGQITELAAEVLNEATEEVDDPQSELQVVKKKLADAEKQIAVDQESLERSTLKISVLEDEIYAKSVELQSLQEKYQSMIENRDSQLQVLRVELERLRQREMSNDEDDFIDDSFFPDKKTKIMRMNDQIEQLKREIIHWKSVVDEFSRENLAAKVAELENELKRQQEKYAEAVEKLSAPQFEERNFFDSEHRVEQKGKLHKGKSLSLDRIDYRIENTVPEVDPRNYDWSQQNMALRKEIEEKSEEADDFVTVSEHMVSEGDRKKSDEFEKEIESKNEIIRVLKDEIDSLKMRCESNDKIIEQQVAKEKEVSMLRAENEELAAAYNDLNDDFENHKAEYGSIRTSNRDLTARIDSLKANLIEYEERYEICKMENAETVQQLDKLSEEFHRLRTSFEDSKSSVTTDAMCEVERLRGELEISKLDRNKLRADVDRFRSAICVIDQDLNRLRESNDRLIQDNKILNTTLDRFTDIRDMLENSDAELKSLREKLFELQREHEKKEQEWREHVDTLSETHGESVTHLEEPSHEAIEAKNDGSSKAASSEGTVDSNGGWEKMVDWDATTAATGTNNTVQSGTSLINELQESLAAVTEKTAECEELKKQKAEIEKELDVRRSCVDELLVRLSMMEAEQRTLDESFAEIRETLNKEKNGLIQEHEEQIKKLKQEYESHSEKDEAKVNALEMELKITVDQMQEVIHKLESSQLEIQHYQHVIEAQEDATSRIESNNEKLSALKQNLDSEKEKNETLLSSVHELQFKLDKMESNNEEVSALKQNLDAEKEKNETLLNSIQELHLKLAKTESVSEDSEKMHTELVSLLEKKHEESVGYHSQLQAVIAEREQLNVVHQEKLNLLEKELQSCKDSRDRALKECDRLRDHLLSVEETSTREAVAAEEREIELRRTIKVLEQRTEESVDTVVESTNAYKQQIAELINEITILKNERDSTLEFSRNLEKKFNETSVALSNLQKVLRDIGLDHKSQVEQYEVELKEFRSELKDLKNELSRMKNIENCLTEEKQQLEKVSSSLKEEITKKDIVIEELETNLDDRARSVDNSHQTSSYKIDDQVLRQLFLSYFTAERDKQPEIALLLASVLGYSQEDVAKINAVNQHGTSGWFTIASVQRTGEQQVSLAEQFVRFLEKESVATAHSLPVQYQSEKETMRSSSLPLQPSSSTSSADLSSILNT